jgi:hypothetical protein
MATLEEKPSLIRQINLLKSLVPGKNHNKKKAGCVSSPRYFTKGVLDKVYVMHKTSYIPPT